jgi:hypothetical protein
VNRVAPDATAFPYRNVAFAPVIAGQWPDAAENAKNIQWVREYWAALHEYSEPGGYINFQDADDQTRIEDNYASNYARLAEVKAKYDPDNFFHVNQNIKPAVTAPPAGAVVTPAAEATPPATPREATPPEAAPPETAPRS